MLKHFLIAIVLCITPAIGQPAEGLGDLLIVYFDDDGERDPSFPVGSPENPYTSVYDIPSFGGGGYHTVFRICGGTYGPGTDSFSNLLFDTSTIQGGFNRITWSKPDGTLGVGIEHDPELYPTVFDGEFADEPQDAPLLLVSTKTTVAIKDLIFKNAQQSALEIETGTVTVENCTFENNTSAAFGSAVKIGESADSQFLATFFKDCSFIENESGSAGGAIWLMDNNGGTHHFEDCVFDQNTTNSSGGAMSLANRSPGRIELIRCSFTNNQVTSSSGFPLGYGGAIYASQSQGGNPAEFRVTDSLFAYNTSTEEGGAIWIQGFEKLLMSNVTISRNIAPLGPGIFYRSNGTRVVIYNSIIWNNGDGSVPTVEYFGATPNQLIARSILQFPDVYMTLSDIVRLAPRFKDPDAGNFHLGDDSPAIDRGKSDYYYQVLESVLRYEGGDLDKNSRFQDSPHVDVYIGAKIDLGCYESPEHVIAEGCSPADLNLDGDLDFFDVSAFIQYFSTGCP